MTGRVVVVGAGPVGLATAMLLARDGYEVTVFEKDAQAPPATAEAAWERWERTGVAQFRGPHFMLPRFRHVLDAEFPVVRNQIVASGGRRMSFVVPPLPGDRSPRRSDERFETVTGRRPVIESAFAHVAADTAGVTIVRGVGVERPVTGQSVRPGIPHVSGVRTTTGREFAADLVIDAMGRRSKLCDWVTGVGGQPPHEEVSDAGFAYYGRYYRSLDGTMPEVCGPLATAVGTIGVITLPADNNTWAVGFQTMAGDWPLKALRHNDIWERVARSIPHVAHWTDGVPLTDVVPNAGVMDRYRRMLIGNQPVVTGLVAVGDASAATNPVAGRGMSLGLAHAVALRDAVRKSPDDPYRLAEAFDRVTDETITPFYREQVEADHQRGAQVQATIDGTPLPVPVADPARPTRATFLAAASHDQDVTLAFFEITCCLTTPADVMRRPGMREKIAAFVGTAPPPIPGPTRSELLALVG